MRRKNFGFTLIELLIVMVILGILASVTYGQFQTSQKKARDAQRKSDLDNIARALELYYNDFQSYPNPGSINWGSPLEATVGSQTVVYMKTIPSDPLSSQSYCYKGGGDQFELFAKLENENDPDYYTAGYTCDSDTFSYRVARGI
jgi:general secretion pathway protein G